MLLAATQARTKLLEVGNLAARVEDAALVRCWPSAPPSRDPRNGRSCRTHYLTEGIDHIGPRRRIGVDWTHPVGSRLIDYAFPRVRSEGVPTRFTYKRGLRIGKPNQQVSVQIKDGDFRIIHAGLLSHWECPMGLMDIREVRVHVETLEIDVAHAGGVATVVLEGADAAVFKMEIARLHAFVDATTALSRELGRERAVGADIPTR